MEASFPRFGGQKFKVQVLVGWGPLLWVEGLCSLSLCHVSDYLLSTAGTHTLTPWWVYPTCLSSNTNHTELVPTWIASGSLSHVSGPWFQRGLLCSTKSWGFFVWFKVRANTVVPPARCHGVTQNPGSRKVPIPPPPAQLQGTQHDRTPYCLLYWPRGAASPNVPLRRQVFWRGFHPPIFLTWTRLSLMCGPSGRIGKTDDRVNMGLKTDRVNMGLLSCCQIHSLTSRLVTQNTFNGIKKAFKYFKQQLPAVTARRGLCSQKNLLADKRVTGLVQQPIKKG